jgi:glutaredoxin 3
MTKPVVIYTKDYCPYCDRAKNYFKEIDVTDDENLHQEMMEKSKRRTVPQIFIGEQHIGGWDDLYALIQKGTLNEILK